MNLQKITPTAHAPYALRFITENFAAADGGYAVEWRYRLGNHTYQAQLHRRIDGMERIVLGAAAAIPATAFNHDRAEKISAKIIAEARS